MTPTPTERRALFQRIWEYTALPDQILTDAERECAVSLRAEGSLIGLHTAIGLAYAPGPHPSVTRFYGAWSVKSPGSLANAASLAALRLTLEKPDNGGKAQAYIFKNLGGLPAAPQQRNGEPLALTLQVPAQLLGLDHSGTVPALDVATLSRGGLTPGRARDLLETHPLLSNGSHHLIIGTRKPKAFTRLRNSRARFNSCSGQGQQIKQRTGQDDLQAVPDRRQERSWERPKTEENTGTDDGKASATNQGNAAAAKPRQHASGTGGTAKPT